MTAPCDGAIAIRILLDIDAMKAAMIKFVDERVGGEQLKVAIDAAIDNYDFDAAIQDGFNDIVGRAIHDWFAWDNGGKHIREAVFGALTAATRREPPEAT